MLTALLVAAILAALLLVYAGTKPDTFRVERSITMQAPPEKVFALLNDFHRWPEWSPWEKLDANMTRTHAGAASGPGAAYSWQGNRKVGEGRMEIVDSSPPSRVLVKLDFLKPFEAHNTAEFTMTPQGDGTNVTWAMYGPNVFMGKVMQVFMNMDKMVGTDFEAGLQALKAKVEK